MVAAMRYGVAGVLLLVGALVALAQWALYGDPGAAIATLGGAGLVAAIVAPLK